ncbi:hypothetical protein BKP35_10595 [Anaerobacillus arseniciselenatis]|uniref:Uncharacterized protein n=1 Tax=Anaerobacillus arseniciselenatis TaxID=85682 RepID=A0A1S2LLR8_9BACI|nr:CBO0543 family protein [Anaerobacillus arseniciselenatis]OIJ12627.1 hypothetical protein BKP35_10595 [Anaerobacillus arseniciselenatis]
MIERIILIFGVTFGLFSFPTLFRKPGAHLWLPLFIINGIVNLIFDKILIETKQVKYPVRLLPKIFKINIIYDLLVCPYLSVWFSKATYSSDVKGLISKLILFGTPQAIYEIILERKTNSLKFIGKWKWFYSAFLVLIVKLISTGFLKILLRPSIKEEIELQGK